eukprot:scaffold4086_cov129-Isochrysis_galbana.AAC.1
MSRRRTENVRGGRLACVPNRTAWLAAVSVLHAFHGVLELRIATNGTCCYTEQIDRSRLTDSDSVSDSDSRRHAP